MQGLARGWFFRETSWKSGSRSDSSHFPSCLGLADNRVAPRFAWFLRSVRVESAQKQQTLGVAFRFRLDRFSLRRSFWGGWAYGSLWGRTARSEAAWGFWARWWLKPSETPGTLARRPRSSLRCLALETWSFVLLSRGPVRCSLRASQAYLEGGVVPLFKPPRG